MEGEDARGGGQDAGAVGQGDEEFDADRCDLAVPVGVLGSGVQGEDGPAGAQGLDGEPFVLGAGRVLDGLIGELPGEHGRDAFDQVGDE